MDAPEQGGALDSMPPQILRSLVRWERLARWSGWIGAGLAGTVTVPVFVHVIGHTEANIEDPANNWLLLAAFLLPLGLLTAVHLCAHRAWTRAVTGAGEARRRELEVGLAERLGRAGPTRPPRA